MLPHILTESPSSVEPAEITSTSHDFRSLKNLVYHDGQLGGAKVTAHSQPYEEDRPAASGGSTQQPCFEQPPFATRQ